MPTCLENIQTYSITIGIAAILTHLFTFKTKLIFSLLSAKMRISNLKFLAGKIENQNTFEKRTFSCK